MASYDFLLMNIAMALVVSLYVFGGERPWVSLTTAVAVGIIQVYALLASAVFSGTLRHSKKKVVDDDEEKPSVASMAHQFCASLATQLAVIGQNAKVQRFAGLFAVLMFGRFLRISGVMTTAREAIPLALVLGGAFGVAGAYIWPRQSCTEGEDDDNTETDDLFTDKCPYSEDFWSDEFESRAANTDSFDEVSLDPSDILSDVYLNLVMK